jgi:hypothetical protein
MRNVRLAVAAAVLALAACGTSDNQCDVSGHACTWLGMAGKTGFNGDGHDRLGTELYWTMDTLFASDGTVYFLDWNNHLVRRVMQDGKVVTVVGWTNPIFPGDGDPMDTNKPKLEATPAGDLGTKVELNHPTDLMEEPNGKILIMAWHNHKIREFDPATGNVRIIAGGGAGFFGDGGPCAMALMKQPSRFAMDEQQNIYLIDQQNQRIRRIDGQTQIITTIAGSGVKGSADGLGTAAQFSWAVGDNPEPEGGIAYASGKLYIADTDNNLMRMMDLSSGMVTTIAGTGDPNYTGDGGPALQATLYMPHAVQIGPDGNVYFADTYNHTIRMIELSSGNISTVVGTSYAGLDNTDDRPATQTQLYKPFGVNFDADGNLYVSDTLNSRILRVAK